MAVMVPSLNPQLAGDDVAVKVGPGKSDTVTASVLIHKLMSRTYKV